MKTHTFLTFLVRCFSIIIIGWSVYSLYRIITTFAPDFSVFWSAGFNLIHHRNPYTDPHLFTINAYPPFTFLFFIPLAFLPYTIAQAVFIILSFISIIGIVLVSQKILFRNIDFQQFLLLLTLTLLSFPTKFTLGMGQINAIAFFFCISAYYFYKNKRSKIAGVLFSMSFLLKPVLGFLLIFFLVKRQWKIILYSILFSLSIIILVVLLFGTGIFIYWGKEIVPHLIGLAGREVYYNQGLMGFLSRLSTNMTIRKYGTIILSLPLIIYPVYLALKTKNENLQFSLFIITLLLVDTLSWQHHFIWLIFPFIALLHNTEKSKKIWRWIILGVSYLFVSWNIKNPSPLTDFPFSLILSNTFYGCFILYLLTCFTLKSRK